MDTVTIDIGIVIGIIVVGLFAAFIAYKLLRKRSGGSSVGKDSRIDRQ